MSDTIIVAALLNLTPYLLPVIMQLQSTYWYDLRLYHRRHSINPC